MITSIESNCLMRFVYDVYLDLLLYKWLLAHLILAQCRQIAKIGFGHMRISFNS